MRYTALIPLRGGSKGIPMKNIKPLNGVPLCEYVITAAQHSGIFNKVIVSTENTEIAKIAAGFGAEIIERPAELATDTATTDSVMVHAAEVLGKTFDVLVTIQATYPYLLAGDFLKAKACFEKGQYNSLFSGTHTYHFLWREAQDGLIHPLTIDTVQRPMRQQWQGTILENGAFYFTEYEFLTRYKMRVGGNIGCYLMPFNPEIDTEADWQAAEEILKNRNHKIQKIQKE